MTLNKKKEERDDYCKDTVQDRERKEKKKLRTPACMTKGARK